MANATESLTEVESEIFQLKDTNYISTDIEKWDYSQQAPSAGQNTLNGSTQIAIEVANTNNPVTLFDSAIKIKGFFYKTGTTTVAAAADLEFAHNWGYSLFTNAVLEINGQVVERVEDVRNATALLGHCLRSKINRDVYGEQEGWIPDSGLKTAAAGNLGWARRTTVYVNANGAFELLLPLSHIFGFCDVRKILYLIPLRLTLTRSTDDQILFHNNAAPAPAADNPTVVLTELKWLIPTITPSTERKAQLNKMLSTNDFIPFTFLKRSTYSTALPAGAGVDWIIKTTSATPRYLLIGCKDLATTGTSAYLNNNASYDNSKITEIQVELNGLFYPTQSMKTDFANNRVSDAYTSYIRFCLKNSVEPSLSQYEFINFYTIFVIDTSAQPEELKKNSILIRVKINRDTTALAAMAYCLLLEDEIGKGFKTGNGSYLEYR